MHEQRLTEEEDKKILERGNQERELMKVAYLAGWHACLADCIRHHDADAILSTFYAL